MMKPPIFIVGVGRSGTTLIRLMLNNHPNIAIPYESHFITDYFDSLDEFGDLNIPENKEKLISQILDEELLKTWDHQFDLENISTLAKENTLSSIISAIYTDYASAKGKLRWGDKSDYLVRIHIINRIFPTAKFIHIIRDGRDVANSVMKLDWGPYDIIEAAEWWSVHVNLGRKMGAMLPENRYMEIRYEDLVTDTEGKLKSICNFIEEKFDVDILNYYKKSSSLIPEERKFQHYNSESPPKKSRVYAWKKEMTSINIDLFGMYASQLFKELNYEIPTRKTNKLILNTVKLFILIKRAIKK